MPNNLVDIKNASVSYDKELVLENINFSVRENDFTGIIGPNGGGKTTLVKMILGLLKPASGNISYGKTLQGDKINIGYLPQTNNIDQKFPISVLDVVLSGLISHKKLMGRYRAADKEQVRKILKQFYITRIEKKPIGELSGGQLQRVFLARALISNPPLVILDEPNTYVDSNFEKELYEILTELNKQMAILLVTHDVGTVSSFVKTIACVNKKLHYHPTNEITNELLKSYDCPIDLITHGKVPHRVLKEHKH